MDLPKAPANRTSRTITGTTIIITITATNTITTTITTTITDHMAIAMSAN